ncbi:hypothetical protein CFC21_100357 [Triticum aestivum]|uniref:FBD domain-containing protein n=1 Tax=Triticum aestivum TaxID=4565 RepID=A0A9R1M0S4_WHEAT|nr:hypothetical protein CFC21_100357 [Triticum aestivum]
MHRRWGPRRRSARLLARADLISELPDDLLLLVLTRLHCAATAARTGILSRRWRSLWPRLRRIVFHDVPFRSLEAVLGCFPLPPPAVSLIVIRLPKQDNRVPKEQRADDEARVNSLLRAAARLEPEMFIFELPSELIEGSFVVDLPCFHRATTIMLLLSSVVCSLPAGVEFPALETLSLSYCTANIDRLLSCCPRLRTLYLTLVSFDKDGLTVNSASLQEIAVVACRVSNINIVAPVLKQLSMTIHTSEEVSVSALAPMVEKVSWHCSWFVAPMFGVWQLDSLELKTAERQGQLPSLHIHASAYTSLFVILHGGVGTFAQELEKHMIAKFSVLELHLTANGHVFGALVFHILGMNLIRCATQMLSVDLQTSEENEECTFDCPCEPTGWRSQMISLTALEEVEINGFGGDDHEIDFLKLIFKGAPMLKKVIVKLSDGASSSSDGCTNIYNMFKAYSSVEFYVYLSSGSRLGGQNCPSV